RFRWRRVSLRGRRPTLEFAGCTWRATGSTPACRRQSRVRCARVIAPPSSRSANEEAGDCSLNSSDSRMTIVVHYKELALKGRNRPWFIQTLVRNLRLALAGLEVQSVRAIVGRI